ncbi:NADPH:quinone reductase [Paraburkholderia metrosideri]|uniref:NADPH:quinone reductase n=1 Tax=Paraburkholderia metrosideri TaxID=580937 RepID=A0ABW9E658_9BURK
MKAAYYDRQGRASEVLKLGEFALPEPGPNEVRVKLHASGVNPSDIKARTGFSAKMGFPAIIPHQDGAGTIDKVGAGVTTHQIGDRVWLYEAQYGRPHGTAAEYVVVPAVQAAALHANVSFEMGACLGIPALTAHRCLFADGPITGLRVLIHGGAGAVGSAAIALAKWAGAWVATTVTKPEHEASARRAGADVVVLRTDDAVIEALRSASSNQGFDRIVEVALTTNLDIDLACISIGSVISTYGLENASEQLALPILKAMVKGCVFRFVYIYTVPNHAKLEAVAAINACLAANAYAPTIGKIVPLERIAEAHQCQESGEIAGKIVVAIN